MAGAQDATWGTTSALASTSGDSLAITALGWKAGWTVVESSDLCADCKAMTLIGLGFLVATKRFDALLSVAAEG